MTFKFNQDVSVRGQRANFIGYMTNGTHAQVCLSEQKFKPNVIIPLGEIAPLIQGSKRQPKPAPVSQVVTGVSE